MKKFLIIGWIGLIVVNAAAQDIEGAFGLKLGEVYVKEVDENYIAAFTPSKPVEPFTFYALSVVPSTKKIWLITAFANFNDFDKANRQKESLMRVIEKKYNAKFEQGLSDVLVHRHQLKKGSRVIILDIDIDLDFATGKAARLMLFYGDENLAESAIEEEKKKEESEINVEGL